MLDDGHHFFRLLRLLVGIAQVFRNLKFEGRFTEVLPRGSDCIKEDSLILYRTFHHSEIIPEVTDIVFR